MNMNNELMPLYKAANDALSAAKQIKDPLQAEIEAHVTEIIDLLKANQDPNTWDFATLTYGIELAHTLDNQNERELLETIYELYTALMLYTS